MADIRKLDSWADQLLDTGKRNSLISYKDTRSSSAEVVFPDCERVFSKCAVGHEFEVFDPMIPDDDLDDDDTETTAPAERTGSDKRFTREEYLQLYQGRIRNDKTLLIYAQTPNPVTAVKNIAKKAKAMLDETGINTAYLAFGFLRWREKETSSVYYRAPLLLVHVNLVTGSIREPVKIEVSDDDVIVNPTFSYLSQAEYGISLPEYEDGESLSSYYKKTAAVFRGLGWNILDECKLGVFSFLKINMYEDLKKNADKILENDNVRALMGEPVGQESGPAGIGGEVYERVVDNPLIELHTVVDADSSQIEAIEMAKSGKSFVLQGPPGTGKSQTITNIIAECLHDGKTILFVSEKQAALNVVFDKLKKAGLSDFCLELHSHKANKKAVIAELERTLELPKSRVSSVAEDEIRQKEYAQKQLDSYAEELHRKRDVIDLSLYQLFERYSGERQQPELKAVIYNIHKKDLAYLRDAVRLLEQYANYIPSVGEDYRQNVWFGFEEPQISYEDRNQLKDDLELIAREYRSLQSTTARIKVKYETPDLNLLDTARWQELLAFSARSDVITPYILSIEAYNYALPYLRRMQELSDELIPLRDKLAEAYEPEILENIDGEEIYKKLTVQFGSFFSRLFNSEYKSTIADLQAYAKNTEKLKYQDACDAAKQVMKLQPILKEFQEAESAIPGCLGACFKGPDTDWAHVMAELDRMRSFFREGEQSFGSMPRMTNERFMECRQEFQNDSDTLQEEISKTSEAIERITLLFSEDTMDLERDSYDRCIRKVDSLLQNFNRLGNWTSFMSLLTQLKDAELSEFVDLVIEEKIEPEKIAGAYRKAFYKQWIENILFSVPELSSFTRIRQDQTVDTFIKKDNLQYEISKAQIRSELSMNRPALDLVAGGSTVAILRREAKKKRRQMSIRKLLAATGDLVQLIKPCFLMSPLSVSTFLDPEVIKFDTVIFDEASQIFPQDAIGAIYRGKQLIVVGDSRQMPPSNFFNASLDVTEDDEDLGDIHDFESILDVCSSVFDNERLSWHYRSHYEQLISFSNLNFYNNQLVTFPSSSIDHKWIGVDYYYVNGVFDRKSKTNRTEAEFIVDLVFKNFDKYPNRSLGVVAFSVSQQNLIDKLILKRREEDESYEEFFKEDRPEPFFVKNLETVQGDERDTIIFSVAYARDSQGRFLHNFGPLNRAGGERRLNVAVTRAKENVQLVASIHYTDIDLSRTGSEGARLLRAYLDYAQNGEQALERTISVSEADHFDSYFEQEVCDYLRDNGFTVDTQVGCSGYKIDLGLRKPDSSNYVLAIECDGATYHNSKNARDRDSLRQRVLQNMGWKFYRIWSTDWYRNKAVEKERLLEVARKAIEQNDSNQRDAPAEQIAKRKPEAEPAKTKFVAEVVKEETTFPEYKQVNAMRIMSEKRYEIRPAVRAILETEAPLAEEYLMKRLLPYYEREKVTKYVRDGFNFAMRNCERYGIRRKDGFLYLEGKTEYKFRVPGQVREIKYIAIEELADGLYSLVRKNISAPKEEIYKKLTNLLGFSRTGEAIVTRYNKALNLLITNNLLKEENGILSVR